MTSASRLKVGAPGALRRVATGLILLIFIRGRVDPEGAEITRPV